MSIIHHTKRQLKNFNKRGQLIPTLMRTFYEARAARRRIGGGVAAVATAWRTAQSTSALVPFVVAHARPAGLL
jgi:hypothetical protein